MTKIDELNTLLRKLCINKQNVSSYDLKTKYKKAYMQLISNIKNTAECIAMQEIFQDIVVFKQDGDSLIRQFQKIIDDKSVMSKISESLFKNYDVSEFMSYVQKLRNRILRVYRVYKRNHVCLEILPYGLEVRNELDLNSDAGIITADACKLIFRGRLNDDEE